MTTITKNDIRAELDAMHESEKRPTDAQLNEELDERINVLLYGVEHRKMFALMFDEGSMYEPSEVIGIYDSREVAEQLAALINERILLANDYGSAHVVEWEANGHPTKTDGDWQVYPSLPKYEKSTETTSRNPFIIWR